MTLKQLEARVAEMEKELTQLRVLVNGHAAPRKKDWRRTIGMFAGDEMAKRIDAFALKYREDDRRKARARARKRRKVRAKA